MLRRQSRAPRSLNDIEFGELIGKGVFGKVYIGHNKSNGQTLAIKEVSGRTLKNKLDFLKETSVLRKVRHPHLLRLRALFVVEHDATDDDLRAIPPRKSRTARWINTLRQRAVDEGAATAGDYSELSMDHEDDEEEDFNDFVRVQIRDESGQQDSTDDFDDNDYVSRDDESASFRSGSRNGLGTTGSSKASSARGSGARRSKMYHGKDDEEEDDHDDDDHGDHDDQGDEDDHGTHQRLPPVKVAYKLYLVTEYCEGSSLNKLLANKKLDLPWETRLRWIMEAAEGLQHLHKHGVIHRDLKSDNCLLRIPENVDHDDVNSFSLVLADFGLSRFYSSGSITSSDMMRKPMTVVGTPWLMAPELMNPKFHDGYTIESEIFTFGVLMLEILTRHKALDIPRNPHTLAIDMHFVREMTVNAESEDEDDESSFFDAEDEGSSDRIRPTAMGKARSQRSKQSRSKPKAKMRPPSRRLQSLVQSCPPLLLDLASDCVALEPKQRPELGDIIVRLNDITDISTYKHT
ncbi:Protein kinase, putative [Hondaea fermentalgiana]|uniref:Protein kinase, putative n=1 Tax=Hondaea fermentalgiana TaxID=2315210 RepID=A0A2R5G920_9STRA|nr:Protein kinase, putative [Hondaea fermentalgiana]|eukprot:GBG27500.1 Protein kinase, putative [Hondaea fermentalgiana]